VSETTLATGAPNGQDAAAVILVPVEQRRVTLMGEDEVVAARVAPDLIYLPLRPLCENLGVGYPAQFARIKKDEVLAEGLRRLKIQTAGGTQTMQCLELEGVPLWLAMIEPGRVRADLRDRLLVYKRWVRKRVWEAFARETGLVDLAPAAPTDADPADPGGAIRSLEQIREMGFAIARMAEQQIAHERRLGTVEARVAGLDGRLVTAEDLATRTHLRVDRAAQVMGETLRELRAVRARLAPGNVISEEQAGVVKDMIAAIAAEMTRRQADAASGRVSPYGALFGELHRRYRVTSYHNIRVEDYPAVLAWLRSYQETLGGADAPLPLAEDRS